MTEAPLNPTRDMLNSASARDAFRDKTSARKAAVLWTGGKDSALALYEARQAGCDIDRLVTFAPPQPDFQAHPVAVMQAQAGALGLSHQVIETGPDFRESYRAAFARLREEEGISVIITGDIDRVDGLPNFVQECCDGLDVEVCLPLWQRERRELLRWMLALGFEIVFSLVKQPWLSAEWLGRRIGADTLRALEAVHRATGMDIGGENGEYHTIVLNGPIFQKRLILKPGVPKQMDQMACLSVETIYADAR